MKDMFYLECHSTHSGITFDGMEATSDHCFSKNSLHFVDPFFSLLFDYLENSRKHNVVCEILIFFAY